MPNAPKRLSRVLIANRGEIACRIARSCRLRGISPLMIYVEADREALHCTVGDSAFKVSSYLAVDEIVEVAKRAGADAVHPGYGFLSERAAFARALQRRGISFIGPPPAATEALGDKVAAKKLARATRVPCIPDLTLRSPRVTASTRGAVEKIGYPVLIKAAGGGGGRGMRVVRSAGELESAVTAASREADKHFGDATVFVEKLIDQARHIEVQIIADNHGNVVALFDRDCSMQRHHQKVIEEAPAPGIAPSLRKRIHRAACDLCRAAGYRNAGTVEFLLSRENEFYFLEVNSRLQVEHPVTELITGLDLVALQFGVVEGHDLSTLAETLPPLTEAGVAIEARLCAEVPEEHFIASTGSLLDFRMPEGEHIRVDCGFRQGDYISPHFDSLLAKIITWAPNRDQAVARLRAALAHTLVMGVRTNLGFLDALLATPAFAELSHTTTFAEGIARQQGEAYPTSLHAALALIALTRGGLEPHAVALPSRERSAWNHRSGWRAFGNAQIRRTVRVNGKENIVSLSMHGAGRFTLADGRTLVIKESEAGGREQLAYRFEQQLAVASVLHVDRNQLWISTSGRTSLVIVTPPAIQHRGTQGVAGSVSSPLPGRIVEVRVKNGQQVERGAVLALLESMKMEHPLTAPVAGTVSVAVASGDTVEAGTVIAQVTTP